MQLSQAIDGFLLFRRAEGLRPRTLQLYRHHLDQFAAWAGDPPLEMIKTTTVSAFLAYLRDDYVPLRVNGDTGPLSSQSVYNAWTTLKSFTRWYSLTFDLPDVMSGQVPRPRVTNENQEPFTEAEVKRLLAAVKPRKGTRPTSGLYYATDLRDQAVILTLLDTGLRASELCALTVGDVHIQSGRVLVADGKGGKSRQVWIGAHTRPAVWRYLQERREFDPGAPLFSSSTGRALTRSALRKRLVAIGGRAGVPDARPHRFRHTFAIQYLRNGGDVFTLQALLGHATMDMVRRYLRLAAADVEQAHRRASPVDNWLK
jgi:integrase/recombinase XerD